MGHQMYIQTADGQVASGTGNTFYFTHWATLALTVETMARFGMVTELPCPSVPEMSSYGLTVQDLEFPSRTLPDPEIVRRLTEFQSAYQTVLDTAEATPDGIPSYKLVNEVGFLVTTAEISAALASYEGHPDANNAERPGSDPTWRIWVAFLRHARTQGGFRAY
ncbi:hypothetical protein SRB5_15970 [Streptomyces sp. RB5]|uniref:Uncharacterized protein n=1 Tax=Streptomyces smaragdinus TaxID=2585196 RepID=A0A7K0CDC7_9ACTN|nr:hypothetical protein [Streptomyces smaragdinus]MQY11478.1 hypothetical protein [Streptomyces smaragdinus]